MTKTFKILSCDGGGIRGLLTTLLLEELEREIQAQTNNPSSSLTDYFDLFAGTSTGSFIACGLANGMRPSQIREFYEQQGKTIFPKMDFRFWAGELLNRVSKGRLSLPLFSPKGLEEVLYANNLFPDSLLFGTLGKPTLVVSYDTYNRKAMVFKSNSEKSAQIPIWQICRSSSAAPVAFPGYLLKNERFLSEYQQADRIEGDLSKEIPPEGLPLIDGGILANNPSLCALAETISQGTSLENIPHSN
jgi:patatin-like phospholipase/acyl hydrolase